MFRLSKLADYGIVIMTHLARTAGRQQAAPEVAMATHVPLPTVAKILKALARAGLVVSCRGAHGGYGLARDPSSVSVAEVIEALEGPIALTSCIEPGQSDLCGIESLCLARANWQRINHAIRDALGGISVAEMASTIPAAFLTAEEQAAGKPAEAGARLGADGRNRFGVG